MAGFDPATIQLQRELLAQTTAQHRRDLDHLRKFQPTSKDKRAEALRVRIGEAVRVSRDLEGLIAFMEAVVEHADLRALVEPTAAADLGPGYKGGDLRPDENGAIR